MVLLMSTLILNIDLKNGRIEYSLYNSEGRLKDRGSHKILPKRILLKDVNDVILNFWLDRKGLTISTRKASETIKIKFQSVNEDKAVFVE